MLCKRAITPFIGVLYFRRQHFQAISAANYLRGGAIRMGFHALVLTRHEMSRYGQPNYTTFSGLEVVSV